MSKSQIVSGFVRQYIYIYIYNNNKNYKKNKNKKNNNKINKKIKKINQREIPNLSKKIEIYKKDINFYNMNLNKLTTKLDKVKDKTPALAMLELNEQRHLTEILFKLRQDLINIEDKKFTLEAETLENLQEKIEDIQTLLKPYNYKNSKVIGKIMTNDYAVEPKKKLIVIVAFITGFILSIFLVFFMQFIKNGKDEKEIENNN